MCIFSFIGLSRLSTHLRQTSRVCSSEFHVKFSLEIYFQMVHSTVGRYETPSLVPRLSLACGYPTRGGGESLERGYETPSLHTTIEMLSGKPGYSVVTAMGRV